MILDVADGVLAASSGARVFALILDAGAVGGAVRAEHTLRATAFVRIAVVVSDTHTSASTVALFALGIGSARGWLAGVDNFNCNIKNANLFLCNFLHDNIFGFIFDLIFINKA